MERLNPVWLVVGFLIVVVMIIVLRPGQEHYLPSPSMCDFTPEYWPKECSEYARERTKIIEGLMESDLAQDQHEKLAS